MIHGQIVTSYETDDNDLDDIITTITIQQPNKVPNPRISTFGRELWRDVIVHFACIRPIATGQNNQYYNYTTSSTTSHYDTYEATTTTTTTKHHGNLLKHHCCSLFEEALSQVCQQVHQQDGDSSSLGGHHSSVLCRQLLHQNSSLVKKERCLLHAAIVPKVAFVSKTEQTTKIRRRRRRRRKKSTHQLSLDPLVYLSLRAQIPSMGDDWLLGTSSLDIVPDTSMSTGRRDRTPLIQWNNYDTKTTKTSWRRYENAYSPFHVKIHRRNENNENMAVSLESNLASEDMGMHRSFTHTLSVDISKPLFLLSLQDGSYKIQLQMFQPLSRDVYLDLDEPFPSGDQSSCRARQTSRNRRLNVINRGTTKDDWFDCKVNLITAPDSVVDIEQPSFASPQHIVAFVIDVPLDAKGNDYKEGVKVVWEEEDSFQITVTFVTQLHFRYADTVHFGKVGKMGTYSKVHVPTPFLHGTRLVTSKIENGTTLSEKTIAYNNHHHYGNKIDSLHHHNDDLSTSGSWEIALAEITTGVDDHHDIVIVVTVLASLVGAWRIIHDMSKVSIWK